MSYLDDKPTVGRIVHFYDKSLPPDANNGIGPGPYAAIITQIHTGSSYANLQAFAYEHQWTAGSVSKKVSDADGRYWEWPPRDVS